MTLVSGLAVLLRTSWPTQVSCAAVHLYIFCCPHFDTIRAEHLNPCEDVEGSVHLFMGHEDQTVDSHCLTAILEVAQT